MTDLNEFLASVKPPPHVTGLFFGLSEGLLRVNGSVFVAGDDDWPTRIAWEPRRKFWRDASLEETNQALRDLVKSIRAWAKTQTFQQVQVGFEDGGTFDVVPRKKVAKTWPVRDFYHLWISNAVPKRWFGPNLLTPEGEYWVALESSSSNTAWKVRNSESQNRARHSCARGCRASVRSRSATLLPMSPHRRW